MYERSGLVFRVIWLSLIIEVVVLSSRQIVTITVPE